MKTANETDHRKRASSGLWTASCRLLMSVAIIAATVMIACASGCYPSGGYGMRYSGSGRHGGNRICPPGTFQARPGETQHDVSARIQRNFARDVARLRSAARRR